MTALPSQSRTADLKIGISHVIEALSTAEAINELLLNVKQYELVSILSIFDMGLSPHKGKHRRAHLHINVERTGTGNSLKGIFIRTSSRMQVCKSEPSSTVKPGHLEKSSSGYIFPQESNKSEKSGIDQEKKAANSEDNKLEELFFTARCKLATGKNVQRSPPL